MSYCLLTEAPVVVEKPASIIEPVTRDVKESVSDNQGDLVVSDNDNVDKPINVSEPMSEEVNPKSHENKTENVDIEIETVVKVKNEIDESQKEDSEVHDDLIDVSKDESELSEVCKPVEEPVHDDTKNTEEANIEPKVSVVEKKIETAAVKSCPSNFTPKVNEDQKQTAKSQASKIMLVRQGSFKSKSTSGDKSVTSSDKKPLEITSTTTIDKDLNDGSGIDDIKVDINKELKSDKTVVNDDLKTKFEERNADNTENEEMDLNKNYTDKVNANISLSAEIKTTDVDSNNDKKPSLHEVKSMEQSSKQNSLYLEDKNVKTARPVAKFRTGGEVRRSQSVRTPGNEKPEWLQVKLKRVGNNPTPTSFLREIEKQQAESNKLVDRSKSVVQDEKPDSVQRTSNLTRSQSVKTVGRNVLSALNDSTNSPAIPSKRDSVKLTPVSERAKIFQLKDSSSNKDLSGKSSPVDIIAKAINLSRAESMRSPAGHRSSMVQRSKSFKTDTPSITSQRDITLELTPQKSQVGCFPCFFSYLDFSSFLQPTHFMLINCDIFENM